MLRLTAFAAVVLMTWPVIASATTATSPKGTTYSNASLMAATEGHAILHDTSGLGITIECNSVVEGAFENPGEGPAKASISSLTWSNCTNNWSVTTLTKGSLEFHNIAGTENGTVTSTGTEITATQSGSGLHCIYKTSNTDIGTLTSSTKTGGNATLDISATIPRTGGSSGFFCGTAGTWTGSYKVSTPSTLYVDS
ncbi:MAG TPA: hypothetical protein VKB23_01595 [Solirubrobacterales bacterium]|nr:hypothetical protein [Solirubrobacterales bacterium]